MNTDNRSLEKQQTLTMNAIFTSHKNQLHGNIRVLLGECMFYAVGTLTYDQITLQIEAGIKEQM